jgi:GntR family transcriptional regulator
MFDRIDSRSPTPIYAQIAENVRVAVASGELERGSGLPSVRVLAAQLRVNPATVVQAYRELEEEGLVQMRQGAGTFVVDVAPERRARERTAAARRIVREMIADAAALGLGIEELKVALNKEIAGDPAK